MVLKKFMKDAGIEDEQEQRSQGNDGPQWERARLMREIWEPVGLTEEQLSQQLREVMTKKENLKQAREALRGTARTAAELQDEEAWAQMLQEKGHPGGDV